jgi:hypothetical protein
MNSQPRLDQVQIKVTLAGPRIADACRTLALHPASGIRHDVFFCVDPATAAEYGDTAPLDDGLVLRVRRISGPGTARARSTVKLRPARRSRLTPEWLRFRSDGDEVFRVEADWAGDRKVLVAALTAESTPYDLDGVLAGNIAPRRLFTPSQVRFLRECADRPVDLDRLVLLGPIEGVRWQAPRPVAGYPVTAERWTLPAPRARAGRRRLHRQRQARGEGMATLLELSTRVEAQGAEIAQIAVESALLDLGLPTEEEDRHTKTHRALARLLGS